MKSKNKGNGKVYRSMIEFEKEIFPDSYEEQLKRRENEGTGLSGTGLVTELLKGIKQDLAK